MTLCDECQEQEICSRSFPQYPINKCSEFVQKISQSEVDYMIRRLLKYFHIPETDEQVLITTKLFQKQAKYAEVQSKTLSFLERCKVKLP